MIQQPRRSSLERRRSSRVEEEHAALVAEVEAEHHEQRDWYVLKHHPNETDLQKLTKQALETVYNLQQLYEKKKTIENVSFAFAMTGLVLIVLDNEVITSHAVEQVIRWLNVALSLILVGLLIARFVVARRILIRRNILPPNASLWRPLARVGQLALEMLVSCLVIPPCLDGTFTVREWQHSGKEQDCDSPHVFIQSEDACYQIYSYPYEIIGLLALFRLYMVPRFIRNLSQFSGYRTSYLGTLHNVDTHSSLFAIKCVLRARPFTFTALCFLLSSLVTSYTLALVEAPANPSLASPWNAAWLVIMTMNSIGYGDYFPVTRGGQVITVVGAMITGILLIGVLSAALFSFHELNEKDRHFLHLFRQHKHHKAMEQASAKLIQASWRYHSLQKRAMQDTKLLRITETVRDRVFQHASTLREMRKQAVPDFRSPSTALRAASDRLLSALRQENANVVRRLLQIDKQLDQMVARSTSIQ